MKTSPTTTASIAAIEQKTKDIEGLVNQLEILQRDITRMRHKITRSSTEAGRILRTFKLEVMLSLICEVRRRISELSDNCQAQLNTFCIMQAASDQLTESLTAAFPQMLNDPAAMKLAHWLSANLPESYTHYKLILAQIVGRIWYSNFPDKVYDPINTSYFDAGIMVRLHKAGRMISSEWLDQLILCLASQDVEDVMNLMEQTPETMRETCKNLFITLYTWTTKHENNG